jgi:hypothetical protein
MKEQKETLPCLACGRVLYQVDRLADENQPYGGTEFRTHGHYGSTIYDPMDGHYLVINICDVCLATNHDRAREGQDYQLVLTDGSVTGTEPVDISPTTWHPSESELMWAIKQTMGWEEDQFTVGEEDEQGTEGTTQEGD